MLVAFTNQINTDLRAHAPLVALLTNGVHGVRPLKGGNNDGEDLVTYYIAYQGGATKGGVKNWQVVVQSWADQYDDSLAIADEVENAIAASSNFYEYISATPRFTEEDIIYTEQIFRIKS